MQRGTKILLWTISRYTTQIQPYTHLPVIFHYYSVYSRPTTSLIASQASCSRCLTNMRVRIVSGFTRLYYIRQGLIKSIVRPISPPSNPLAERRSLLVVAYCSTPLGSNPHSGYGCHPTQFLSIRPSCQRWMSAYMWHWPQNYLCKETSWSGFVKMANLSIKSSKGSRYWPKTMKFATPSSPMIIWYIEWVVAELLWRTAWQVWLTQRLIVYIFAHTMLCHGHDSRSGFLSWHG